MRRHATFIAVAALLAACELPAAAQLQVDVNPCYGRNPTDCKGD